jgi:hypothetical protein
MSAMRHDAASLSQTLDDGFEVVEIHAAPAQHAVECRTKITVQRVSESVISTMAVPMVQIRIVRMFMENGLMPMPM